MNPDDKKSSVQYKYSTEQAINLINSLKAMAKKIGGMYVRKKKRGEGGYRKVINLGKWSSWRTCRVRILYEMKSLKTAQWRQNLFLKYRGNVRDIGESRHHLILYWQECPCTCMNLENLHSGLLVGQRDLNFPETKYYIFTFFTV
jgi:hypothetical protein